MELFQNIYANCCGSRSNDNKEQQNEFIERAKEMAKTERETIY